MAILSILPSPDERRPNPNFNDTEAMFQRAFTDVLATGCDAQVRIAKGGRQRNVLVLVAVGELPVAELEAAIEAVMDRWDKRK